MTDGLGAFVPGGEIDIAGAARGQLAGFYSLERLSPEEVELGYLYVEPEYIGGGHGSRLIAHAVRLARGLGYQRMVIQSDPNAEGFYAAAGGARIGSKESLSIPGRQLPLVGIVFGIRNEVELVWDALTPSELMLAEATRRSPVICVIPPSIWPRQ